MLRISFISLSTYLYNPSGFFSSSVFLCQNHNSPTSNQSLARQVIVQRTLAAKNMVHAKGGVVLAAVLKFLPLFLLVFPGMAARVLYTDTVACSDPAVCKSKCDSETGCSNLAYIELVLNLLPRGARRLCLCVGEELFLFMDTVNISLVTRGPGWFAIRRSVYDFLR